MIAPLLVAVLKAAPGVTAIVGSGSNARIHPEILPQTASAPTVPAITYQGAGQFTQYHHEGPGIVRVRLQIDSWATTRLAADTLARAVRDALHDYPGDPDGIQDFEATESVSMYEDEGVVKLYRRSDDYFAYVRDQAA